MLPFLVILAAGLLGATVSLRRFLARYPEAGQRSWWVRVSIFSVVGILFLVLFILPLPNKQRLLAIVPAFFLIAVATRVFRAARTRVRNEAAAQRPDLERMKRLN